MADERNDQRNPDIVQAVLKLTRSLHRRPPTPPGREGPPRPPVDAPSPASLRLLDALCGRESARAYELSELLDARPSAVAEMLASAEAEGFITCRREAESNRVSGVLMTDKGRVASERIRRERQERLKRIQSCFTRDEAAQFCALCDRLTGHLDRLAREDSCRGGFLPPPPPPPYPKRGADDPSGS